MFGVLFQVGFQGVEPKSVFSRIKESIQGSKISHGKVHTKCFQAIEICDFKILLINGRVLSATFTV
jgi:hypothetical protein